jgi:uncharacterized membrane protein (DUF2068 family)
MVDWSLLACGRYGHVTYAPAEPELREQLCSRTATGEAWRCLRCGTFVSGDPGLSGPAGDAPQIRRGQEIRSALILRIFAVERFLRALVFFVLAYALWRFRYSRRSIDATFDRDQPVLRALFHQLGYNIDKSKLVGLIHHALALSPGWITLLAAGLALYAIVELIEGTGLWLARRWGEYFAMVATSAGLPLEIYELAKKVTVTPLVLFAINLALVLYLVLTKRLFGARGGKQAYDARLRSESVLEAAILAAGAAGAAEAAVTAGAGADQSDGDRVIQPDEDSASQLDEDPAIRPDPALLPDPVGDSRASASAGTSSAPPPAASPAHVGQRSHPADQPSGAD